MGKPRTGKTILINNFYDFFAKGNFNIAILEEYTTSLEYRNTIKAHRQQMSTEEFLLKILEEVKA